jgi:hypothetical protein
MNATENLRPIKRLAAGRYVTRDGLWIIESDSPGLGESYDLQGNMVAAEQPRANEWFIYDNTDPMVQRDDYGPPDAKAEAETLREARAYIERWLS